MFRQFLCGHCPFQWFTSVFLECIIGATHLPLCFKQLTLSAFYDQHLSSVHVYTDEFPCDNSVAASVVIASYRVTKRFKLSHSTSSTAEEPAVILKGSPILSLTQYSTWQYSQISGLPINALAKQWKVRGIDNYMWLFIMSLHFWYTVEVISPSSEYLLFATSQETRQQTSRRKEVMRAFIFGAHHLLRQTATWCFEKWELVYL